MTRPISRRAFIGGAGAATALAAAGTAWVGLRRRDGDPPLPSSPLQTPTPRPTPTALPPPPPGGRQFITAPGALDIDTFDAQLTGKSQTVEILGRTHSRLLNWDNADKLQPDLAERWEMPDAETVVFHLNPSTKWHDRPPLNGRPVTAADIVAHFQRSLEIAAGGKAPLAQRYHDYASIMSVDSPAEGQVRFRLNKPDPFFLGTLAGEFALIQAPGAVSSFGANWSKLDSDHVIGSGPWTFDWIEGGAKFTAFTHGHRRPSLEELVLVEPRNAAKRFIEGTLDEALIRDRRDAALLKSRYTVITPLSMELRDLQDAARRNEVFVERRYEREIVMSSFFVGAPPWNNPAFTGAISGALNRFELAKRLFAGRARPAPPIPPAMAGDPTGRISGERLKFVPGYPFLEGEYTPDPQVRRAWEAAGGPALGTITIDCPSVFDPLYSASSIVIDMLNEALGPQFRPAVETYTTISKRVLDSYYGNGRAAFWFGWGAPLPSPSAELYMSETYAKGSPGQRITGGRGLAPGDDPATILQSGFFGIVPWVQQFAEIYRRPLTSGPEPSPFWNQHRDPKRANLT